MFDFDKMLKSSPKYYIHLYYERYKSGPHLSFIAIKELINEGFTIPNLTEEERTEYILDAMVLEEALQI